MNARYSKCGSLPFMLSALLPNIPGIRREIQSQRDAFFPQQASSPFWYDLDELNASLDTRKSDLLICSLARISPGTVAPVEMTMQHQKYYQHVNILAMPTDTIYTWKHVLGLDADISWFASLAAQMAMYASYWKDSSTFASIPVFNGSAGLVVV